MPAPAAREPPSGFPRIGSVINAMADS